MNLWKSSIFWRIYLLNLAIICVLLTSMFAISRVTLPDISRGKFQEITDTSANRLKEQVGNVVDYLHELTTYVQGDKEFASHDPAVMQSELVDLVKTSALIDNATISDEDGIVIASTPADLSDTVGEYIGDREYVVKAMGNSSAYLSDVNWTNTGRPVLVISIPILDENEHPMYCINLALRLSDNKLLSNLFQKIDLGAGGYVYIFDRNGHLISHPDHYRIGEDISQNEVVQEVLKHQDAGYRKVTNTKGILMDASFAFVPEVGWGVVAQVPDAASLDSFFSFRNTLQLLSLIVLVPLALVTALLALQIIKPIRTLYDAVDQVARGDYESDLALKASKNEIGQLSKRFNEMFQTIRNAREQIEYQALHDPLTGLPNRTLLADRIGQMIAHADRSHTRVAVAFLNLDRFKAINDSLGHSIGDRLLCEVAQRINEYVSDSDTVSRIGGDEFLLAMPNVEHMQDVLSVVHEVLKSLNIPFLIDGHELFLTASIGISFYPSDGLGVEELIKNADMAMHRAKELGRNICQLHTPAMNTEAEERLVLENHLRRALEREEFLVYYQPKIDLISGHIVGMEALLRWNHSIWGMISPAKFIPIAEDTGLIGSIGEWVLRTACADTKRWQDLGLPPLRVAVNLSAHQVHQPNLVETVEDILEKTGLHPQYLELELTESILMQNTENVIDTLHRLREMDIAIAIDDFGIGYSSLSYLQRFPISTLKIDQSFVSSIVRTGDRIDGVIAKVVLALAHNLGLESVAEGVETPDQQAFLQEAGCDFAQGFLYSRPIPAQDFEYLLLKNESASV
ncbi:EAL domain-containing protein [Tumebacillus sp. ITR2]|uniref:EAL domain-containing protein n=1 Tax=Tumebacillus amylolyticus TaxID=2801339 RepID=A0ABS1J4U7_9BACL|nr:EAL domain-containing protein [Tumebacillus amylolyticus]MBL0385302.1 EAL domain-containing protein [Tumebacillus amylolyticus]